MVIGQIMPTNPAAAVRGPRHIVRRGETPVLDPAEARQLIDSIDTTTLIGLRDRALISLMVYSFARIGAAIGMRVEDVYTQNRRLWVRCTRRAASSTPCRASTISNPICTRTSTARARERSEGAAVSDLQPHDWPAHRQSPAPGERLRDDPEALAVALAFALAQLRA